MNRSALVAHAGSRTAPQRRQLRIATAAAALPVRARPEELVAALCLTGVLAILFGAIAAAVLSPALSRHGATAGLVLWAAAWASRWIRPGARR
jgi:hypothetical protein